MYIGKVISRVLQRFSVEKLDKDWKDGSVVNNTGCPSRGLEFNLQHPKGSSQLPIALVPGDLTATQTCVRANHQATVFKKTHILKMFKDKYG